MRLISKTIKTPPLFPWQEAIIKSVLSYPSDIHVVKSKRQIGKSVSVEMLLLHYAINKFGSTSICVSPTLNQSRKIFKELVRSVQSLPVYKGSNATTLEIEFTNNSTILLKSGEQRDALRGNTVSGILIFDEAVFISDTVIYECLPFVDANHAPILLTSTPKLKAGAYYDWWVKALESEKGFHYVDVNDFDTSALLSPERLELYRKSVAPQVFRTEFLGEFIDAVSDLFGDVESLVGSTVRQTDEIVAGIDWGTGSGGDDTAIVIMNKYREVLKCWAFNDLEPLETIDFIVSRLKEYGVRKCVVETNSIGSTYISLLKRKVSENGLRCQIVEFTTSNESKRALIEDLQVQCLNKTIQIPKDNKLILEMVSYEMQKTPGGKVTFGNCSPSVHDDLVIALGLANWSLKSGTYNIR